MAWKNSIETVFRYTPHYLLATSGDQIRAVLPLFVVSNDPAGQSPAFDAVCGLRRMLADSPEAQAALRDEVEDLSRRMRVEHAELRNAHVEQCVGFSNLSRYVSFVQQIGPDEEAILADIPRKTRYMVRKALKQPFSMEPRQILRRSSICTRETFASWGRRAFRRRHFHTLLQNFGKEADVREVRLDGKVVSAVLTFYFRDQVLPYYGASDRRITSTLRTITCTSI